MLALVSVFVQALTAASNFLAEHSGAAQIIATVFNPTWNVENRGIIWTIIVSVLFMSGMGLPLPEDIPLTLAGFTTIKQANEQFIFGHFALAFVGVTIPILLGDMIAYSLGRKFGFGIRDRIHLLRRLLSDKRLARVQRWFDHYGSFTIFLGRQMAGVRFVTFFTAGTMRVPLVRFVLYDFLGCLVSVPVWLGLGVLTSRYGEEWLRTAVRRVSGTFFVVSLLVLGVFVLVTRMRGVWRAREAAGVQPPAGSSEEIK